MKKLSFIFVSISVIITLMLMQNIVSAQNWTFTSGPYRPHEVRDLSSAKVGSVQTIYAADVETLKYSTNGGTSWLNTSSLMLNPLVVAVKPVDANIVHVAKIGELRLSTNGGGDWGVSPKISDPNLVPLRLSESTYDPSIWLLGADTVKRGTLWTTTSLYRTINGGATWSPHNYFLDNAHTNVNDPIFDPRTSSQKVWIGGSTKPIDQQPDMSPPQSTPSKGVWHSANGGESWSFRSNFPVYGGNTDQNVTAIALSDGPTSDILYAVTTKFVNPIVKAQLYYVNPDGGDIQWTTGANLYDDLDVVTGQQLKISLVRTMKVNPVNPNNFIAVTNKGLAVSTDRGVRWTLRNYPPDIITAYQAIHDKIDPTGNTVYIGTDLSVYKSANQGQNWSENEGIFNFMNTASFAINGATAHSVCNSYAGIAKLSNSTWDKTPKLVGQKMFSGKAVAINKNFTLFANAVGDSAGLATIYVREDGGDGWRKVFTSGTGTYSTSMYTVVSDPKTNSQRVYAGGKFYVNELFYNFIRSTR